MDEDVRAELTSLRANYRELARRIRRLEKWEDTVTSPLWKRLVFVAQGYRFSRLGVWYCAPWNSSGRDY